MTAVFAQTMQTQDDLSSLTDDQLVKKFLQHFDAVSNLAGMMNYSPIVDSINHTTIILKNNVSNLITDPVIRDDLLNQLDQTTQEIKMASYAVFAGNATGVNQSLILPMIHSLLYQI